MKIKVFIRPGRAAGCYQAYCPDLIGCSAVGASVDEAVRRVRERVAALLAEQRQPIPASADLLDIELQDETCSERESGA